MSGTPNTGASKAYSTHLAVQTDAAKYRGKYKMLKKKVRQIEQENDKLHFKTLRIKRNIQRMRLERAILYERLEAEIGANADLVEQPQRNSHSDTHPEAKQQEVSPLSPHPVAADHSKDHTAGSRRAVDYSPSPNPEEEADKSPAGDEVKSENRDGRASNMKITIKRNSQAAPNGKEDSHESS